MSGGRESCAFALLLCSSVGLGCAHQTPGDEADRGSFRQALAHPDDPSKQTEHEAMLALIPPETATHTAVQSGSWFDPTTWATGSVPDQGAIVHIPENTRVGFDGASLAHIFAIRVDGQLDFSVPNDRAATTSIAFDTLVVTGTGSLSIVADQPNSGSIDLLIRPYPIQLANTPFSGWGKAARLHYSDGLPVTDTGAGTNLPGSVVPSDGSGVLGRYAWDPLQLSLGLVNHGATVIHGRPKTARIRLDDGPSSALGAGTKLLVLPYVPNGWQVGDQVVVTSTHYVLRTSSGKTNGSQDELRTLSALNGTTVILDRPLDYDHESPAGKALFPYVVNLSRNVRIRSTTQSQLNGVPDADAVGSVASRLGHVMFMHSENVDVRHAAFDNLGRSNKNDVLDDFLRNARDDLDAGRARDANGEYQPTPVDNVTNRRGRYAVHFHRTGVTQTDSTAQVHGCVVTGGPGWGFVSHDSRVDFIDNVSFRVLGSGFVAETGNETGLWQGNTAIETYGAEFNAGQFDQLGKYPFQANDSANTVTLDKRGAWKNHDMGHFGEGFWLQGKLVELEDNVAVSSGLSGYFLTFRAPDQIKVLPESVVEPLSIHSPSGVHPMAPGLNVFEDNESIADTRGLEVVGIGGSRINDERSIVNHFTAWEVGEVGTQAQYYPGYTIKNSSFFGSATPGANTQVGVRWKIVTVDAVLANLSIEGFDQRYDLRKKWSQGTVEQQGYERPELLLPELEAAGEPNPMPLGYAHVVINAGFGAETASAPQNMGDSYAPEDLILTSSDLVRGRFEIELDDTSLVADLDNANLIYGVKQDPTRPTLEQGHALLLKGYKWDSIGPIPIDYYSNVLVWHPDAIQHRLDSEGYYRMPNGMNGTILEELFSDRYTGQKRIVRFVAVVDPRWGLSPLACRGVFDPAEHPGVYVAEHVLHPPRPAVRRINAGGGGDFVDIFGYYWQADNYVTGGKAYYGHDGHYGSHPVKLTDNDEIHYGKRAGNDFKYEIPISNGSYDVVLHFMEPREAALVGDRIFNVKAEGVLALANYDIMQALGPQAAGRAAVAATLHGVNVNDGILTLRFIGVKDTATLSGIEVFETQPDAIRIAAGDGPFTDVNGLHWYGDIGYSSGKVYYNASPVWNTYNDEVHYGKRTGNNFSYAIAVKNGTYDLVLHFMETSNLSVGDRVFDVFAEGKLVLDDYDILAALGPRAAKRVAREETARVTITDGVLNLQFQSVSAQPVTLSGFELRPPRPDPPMVACPPVIH